MDNIKQLVTRSEITTDLAVSDYFLNRLSENDKVQFEQELCTSETLQAQLEQERALAKSITSACSETTVSDKAFAEFSGRIESSSPSVRRRAHRMVAGFAAVATFVALVFVQAPQQVNNQEFETLTNNSQSLINNDDKRLYSVVFAPELSAADKKLLSEQLNLTIVSGPGEGQAYIVETKYALNKDSMANIRKHNSVLFFEPAVLGKKDTQ